MHVEGDREKNEHTSQASFVTLKGEIFLGILSTKTEGVPRTKGGRDRLKKKREEFHTGKER